MRAIYSKYLQTGHDASNKVQIVKTQSISIVQVLLVVVIVFTSYYPSFSYANSYDYQVKPDSNTLSTFKQSTVSMVNESMLNLEQIDNQANDLNQLNRTIQLEKARQEIKKIRNGNEHNGLGSENDATQDSISRQTTVLGVAIMQSGAKMAWLQFADGGTLMVTVGAKVGKYTVTNISMTIVTLAFAASRRHQAVKYIYLKRHYPESEYGAASQRKQQHSFFAPSPIITNANVSDRNFAQDDVMVPPLVKVN